MDLLGGDALLRDSVTRLLIGISLISAAMCLVVVLAGCGKNEVDSSATVTPLQKATPNVPAAGPAISDNLTFDQLALDSPVKRVQNKQGIVYLHFSFTDRSGKVYRCELPEAQSKGSYPRDEWLAVFNAYRLPTVVKQKAPPPNPLKKAVTDFPFISPRPGATNAGSPGAPPPPRADGRDDAH